MPQWAAMDFALYASFVSFVVIMSITPGPNNFMLMSSSMLFGVRATLPHWIGINVGVGILLAAAVFGLGALVERFPGMLQLARIAGAVWLGWMAWQFLRAAFRAPGHGRPAPGEAGRNRPFRIYEAVLFQWVNPKALLVSLSAAGAYIALIEPVGHRAFVMSATFVVLGAPCAMAWMLAGGVLRRFMDDPRWSRLLNLVIAGILVMTIGLIVQG